MKSHIGFGPSVAMLAAVITVMSLSNFAVSAEEPESKVAIPMSEEGIWKAIDQEMATLDQLITGNKLATVHQHAYAVRDLAAALAAHAGNLLPAERETLAADNRFVAALAARLDQSGDSGDQAGARSNYDKLKGVIATIRNLLQGAAK